jgi:predicted lipid-binding transport protein (Tim44 family)
MMVGMTLGAVWLSRWQVVGNASTLSGMLGGMFVGMTWGMVVSVALYRGFFLLRHRAQKTS